MFITILYSVTACNMPKLLISIILCVDKFHLIFLNLCAKYSVGRKSISRKYLFLENKTQFWRRTTGNKNNMCEGKPHAKKESIQGVQVGKPNHVRVRVLVRDCNG